MDKRGDKVIVSDGSTWVIGGHTEILMDSGVSEDVVLHGLNHFGVNQRGTVALCGVDSRTNVLDGHMHLVNNGYISWNVDIQVIKSDTWKSGVFRIVYLDNMILYG